MKWLRILFFLLVLICLFRGALLQEKLLKLQLIRDEIIRESKTTNPIKGETINRDNSENSDKNMSTMLERERRRLIVLERRQRRELEQVIRSEQRRVQLVKALANYNARFHRISTSRHMLCDLMWKYLNR